MKRNWCVFAGVVWFLVFGGVALGEEGLTKGLMRLHMRIEAGIGFAEYRDAVIDLKMLAMEGKATDRELAVLRCHTDALEFWGTYRKKASTSSRMLTAEFTKERHEYFYKTYGHEKIKPRIWTDSGRTFYFVDKDGFDILLQRIWAYAEAYMSR